MGKDPSEIRREIEATRERMGETIEALAYKADVKSRVKEAVDERVEGAKHSAGDILGVVKEKVIKTAAVAGEVAAKTAAAAQDVASKTAVNASEIASKTAASAQEIAAKAATNVQSVAGDTAANLRDAAAKTAATVQNTTGSVTGQIAPAASGTADAVKATLGGVAAKVTGVVQQGKSIVGMQTSESASTIGDTGLPAREVIRSHETSAGMPADETQGGGLNPYLDRGTGAQTPATTGESESAYKDLLRDDAERRPPAQS